MNESVLKILLIEDNPGDVELTRVGLEGKSITNKLMVISDGQLAMEFFEKSENLPDIVLLDINLPKVDGFEILMKIRAVKNSKDLPVVMLTSSETEVDVKQSRDKRADCYLTKPVDFDAFYDFVNHL